jgi:molybdate transport system ATP-binding protein
MIDLDIEQQLGAFHLSVAFRAEAPIVGLFGGSGSGKTSVVNAIAGISRPHRGSIVVDGKRLFDAAQDIDLAPETRRVGYVFQDSLLFPHLDVRANLLYGRRLRPRAEHFIDMEKVVELLGIASLLGRRPIALSGGEKQRVAIGRALLAQPRIMLFDEPLASLDASRKSEILAYIERLRDELHIPMVYVSHSVPEIARLADTVVLLSGGKSVAAGNTEDVMRRAHLTLAADDRDGVGSLIDTRVVGHDAGEQLTTLAFDGGKFFVPLIAEAPGERVRARIQARDVALALRPPGDTSILNILPAKVASIGSEDESTVDVELTVGTARIVARITRRSLREMRLRGGQEVYALVKAVSFNRDSVGLRSQTGQA